MLRRAGPEDAELIAGWLSDPAINRYLTSNLRGAGLTPQLVQIGLRRKDQAWFVFGGEEGGAPQGLVAVDSIDDGDGVANLWFVLGDTGSRRQGLTSRAIRRFCAENPLRLHVAMAWAAEPNTASQKCLVRAGFAEIGRVPDAVNLGDGRAARVIFARGFSARPGS